MSTYIHDQLGLSRNYRLFELKQACYSGTAGDILTEDRSYAEPSTGAGCSEFYSGVVSQQRQAILNNYAIERHFDERYPLTMAEYDNLLLNNNQLKFGTRNVTIDDSVIAGAKEVAQGRGQLVLREIREIHREYEWIQ